MPNPQPAIAQIVNVYTMTDGTLRVCEFSTIAARDFSCEPPVFCETPEDVLDYLRDTDALAVNPAWYEENVDND